MDKKGRRPAPLAAERQKDEPEACLKDRIAPGDGGLAEGAAPALKEPACHGHKLQNGEGMVAVAAVRSRPHKAVPLGMALGAQGHKGSQNAAKDKGSPQAQEKQFRRRGKQGPQGDKLCGIAHLKLP